MDFVGQLSKGFRGIALNGGKQENTKGIVEKFMDNKLMRGFMLRNDHYVSERGFAA